jgi:8-oxo-dGTP pyrophosphatase MutT (NUDIX family)
MINADYVHGVIVHENSGRKDSLIRVTLKAVILDDKGRILVVKERGRDWWDIPGGGIDHGETIGQALKRELCEEVSFQGDFDFEVLLAEDPHYLENLNLYQMRITFLVKPNLMVFEKGVDGDEVQFVDADIYKKSDLWTERQIFKFSALAKMK